MASLRRTPYETTRRHTGQYDLVGKRLAYSAHWEWIYRPSCPAAGALPTGVWTGRSVATISGARSVLYWRRHSWPMASFADVEAIAPLRLPREHGFASILWAPSRADDASPAQRAQRTDSCRQCSPRSSVWKRSSFVKQSVLKPRHPDRLKMPQPVEPAKLIGPVNAPETKVGAHSHVRPPSRVNSNRVDGVTGGGADSRKPAAHSEELLTPPRPALLGRLGFATVDKWAHDRRRRKSRRRSR